MKNTGSCPKCESKDIMSDLSVPDHYEFGLANDMQLKASANPDAWFNKGTVASRLLIDVCASCGFAELRVEQPRVLWEAYRQAMGR